MEIPALGSLFARKRHEEAGEGSDGRAPWRVRKPDAIAVGVHSAVALLTSTSCRQVSAVESHPQAAKEQQRCEVACQQRRDLDR